MTARERSGEMLTKEVTIVTELHDNEDNTCLYVMQPEQPMPPDDIKDFTLAATTTLQQRA
jgi:hypothetical protein